MSYVAGFLVWIAFAVVATILVWSAYRGPATTRTLTFMFAFFGTFIGGMLGTSAYVFHDPTPLRVGALIGAVIGAFLFPFVYHLVGRKAL